MPILTLEAIRENPWNVVDYNLPPYPDPILLEAAQLAATYCRDAEHLLMMAARDADYVPEGWEANEEHPDVHEDSEARSFAADRKLAEICELYENEGSEPSKRERS